MKRIIFIAPIALAIAVPALAGSFYGFRGHQRSPEKMLEHADRVMDEVDATDEQKESARSILEGALPTFTGFHEEAGQLREEIKTVFSAETIDRGALEDSRLELLDLADRASAFAFTTMADVAEVFTVEQREELQELREKRHKAHGERRGGRRGHGHGPR